MEGGGEESKEEKPLKKSPTLHISLKKGEFGKKEESLDQSDESHSSFNEESDKSPKI